METKKKSAKAELIKDETASQDAKRLPVRSLREGDCNASIWAREVVAKGAKRVFFSVTLERSFKDPTSYWQKLGITEK